MTDLPALGFRDRSYAVIQTSSGECVLELDKDDPRLSYLRPEFHLVPIGEYLCNLNQQIKNKRAKSHAKQPSTMGR